MKHLKCLILAVFIVLPLCVYKVSAASLAVNNPAPEETTALGDVEQDYFQSDDFILVNSPDFEPFEFFGEKHLQTILQREGIEELNFFRYTNPDSIIVGKIGDIIVGQMQMDDGVVWNVRIEKADDFVNNTGIDMSSAEKTSEHERSVHGMQLVYKTYVVDFADMDAIDAALEAGEELNLSIARAVKIEFVLNQTKSMLYTFYMEGCWEKTGENSIKFDPSNRAPSAIIKSDADYEMEAYQEELQKRTEELEKKFK